MSTGPSAGGCLLHYDSYLESLKVYKEEIRGPEITAVHSSSLLKLPSAPKDKRGEFALGTQSISEEKKKTGLVHPELVSEQSIMEIKSLHLKFSLHLNRLWDFFLPAGLF